MKNFAFQDRTKTIGSFSIFSAFVLSAITAYPLLELFPKPDMLQSEMSNSMYHGIIFIVSFFIYFFGVKAVICWHVVNTQKKLGENITFWKTYIT